MSTSLFTHYGSRYTQQTNKKKAMSKGINNQEINQHRSHYTLHTTNIRKQINVGFK